MGQEGSAEASGGSLRVPMGSGGMFIDTRRERMDYFLVQSNCIGA